MRNDEITSADFNSIVGQVFSCNFGLFMNVAIQRVHNIEIAEDIVHDVFAKVLGNKNKRDMGVGFIPFFVVSIRNACNDFYRKSAKDNASTDTSTESIAGNLSDTTDETVEIEYWLEKMEEAIALLPPRQQKIVDLRYFGKLTYKQIADELQIAVKTVEVTLRNAIINLRNEVYLQLSKNNDQ